MCVGDIVKKKQVKGGPLALEFSTQNAPPKQGSHPGKGDPAFRPYPDHPIVPSLNGMKLML